MLEMLTPKESNVYSKLIHWSTCDSFGVEPDYERYIYYKHAIPPGLAWQRSCKLLFCIPKKKRVLEYSNCPLKRGKVAAISTFAGMKIV